MATSFPPRPPPHANWRRLALILAVVGSVALVGGVAYSTIWRPGRKSGVTTAPIRAATLSTPGQPPPAPAAPSSPPDQATYWREHKGALRRLLTVDYQAALARRNAQFPDLAAVVKFGKENREDFSRRNREFFKRLEDQEEKMGAKFKQLEANHKIIPDGLIYRAGILADTQPIPETHLTVGDLARKQVLDEHPGDMTELRKAVVETERLMLRDEAAAKLAEAVQTPQEMADYFAGAWPRWKEAQRQACLEVGVEPEISNFLLAAVNSRMIDSLAREYQRKANRELEDLDQQSGGILRGMDGKKLAADSRDDPEARRLLTELKELTLLRQQQKTDQ